MASTERVPEFLRFRFPTFEVPMPMPTKPRSLRLISGTRRPAPAPGVEIALLQEAPAAPEWVTDPDARAEWERVAPILVANQLLADADLSALGHMCALHGMLVACWRRGEVPLGTHLAQYHALASAFGLTQASRSKIRPASASSSSSNPFDSFR
jgi:phage terminase small subunit